MAEYDSIKHPHQAAEKMEHQRYVETNSNSYFGDYLYDRIVPQEHFLRKLREVVDWGYFTERLIKLYKGQGVVGRLPFAPALVLKVEVIAYLYKLSERQVEVYVNENLPAKYFVGLGGDGKAPDHSTLTIFRERLLKNCTLHPNSTQEKGWSVNTLRMYPMYLWDGYG